MTCQWPAPLHPVASKGMVNQAFHVPRHVGVFTAALRHRPPSASPTAPRRLPGSVVPVRNLGCTPRCCVIPVPCFFFFVFCFSVFFSLKTTSHAAARWASPQPTKQTDESNVSTPRTYCTARLLSCAAAHPGSLDPLHVRRAN